MEAAWGFMNDVMKKTVHKLGALPGQNSMGHLQALCVASHLVHHHLALIFLATLPNSLPCILGANIQPWADMAGRQPLKRAATTEGSLGHFCTGLQCLCLGRKHFLAAR